MRVTNSITLQFLPLLLFAILFGINTASIPSSSDDILYEYYYPEVPLDNVHGVDIGHPIKNLRDITESIYHHYFNMNGRAPVHFAVQLFCGILGKKWFGIVSFLGIIIFSYLFWSISFPDKRTRSQWAILFPVILFLLFYCEPAIWLSIAGSFNYLFPPILCFLYWLLLTRTEQDEISFKLYSIIPLCLLSFFAGWSHEGFVIPISISCISYFFRKHKQFSLVNYLMMAFWGIGAAFLIFAPSNFNRVGGNIGWTWDSACNLFQHTNLLAVMCVLMICLTIKSRRQAVLLIKENMDFLIGILCGFFFFSLLPNPAPRSGFGIDVLAVVVSCRALSFLVTRNSILRLNIYVVNLIAVVGAIVVLIYQQRSNEQMNELTSQLETNEQKDFYVIKSLVTPPYIDKFLSRCIQHESLFYTEWHNAVYSLKYGKDDLVVIDSDEEFKALPGNTGWQNLSSYWFSPKPFPQECTVYYHIDYSADLSHMIIWMIKKILHQDTHKQKEANFKLFDDSFIYKECRDYYLIDSYISNTWIIDRVFINQ